VHRGPIDLRQVFGHKLRPAVVCQVLRQHLATRLAGPRRASLFHGDVRQALSQQSFPVVGGQAVVGLDEGAEPTSRVVDEVHRPSEGGGGLEGATRRAPPAARPERRDPREGLREPEVAMTGVPEKQVVAAVPGEQHLGGARHIPTHFQHSEG
jgi:hypothetical protein